MSIWNAFKNTSLATVLGYVLGISVTNGLAHYYGMFWRVPQQLRGCVGDSVPFTVFLELGFSFTLAYLPCKGAYWFICHMLNLDKPAEATYYLQLFAKTIFAAVFFSAAAFIFGAHYIGLGLQEFGQLWMFAAGVSFLLIIANDRLITAVQSIWAGKISEEDATTLLRAIATFTLISSIASFIAGDLRMGYMLHSNHLVMPSGATKMIMMSQGGHLQADYYGGKYDLEKEIVWYCQYHHEPAPYRLTNTTDLLARETLGNLFGLEM